MTKSKRITAVQFPDGETHTNDRGLWDDSIAKGRCVALYGKDGVAALRAYRGDKLREFIKPKTTIKAVDCHRSASGGVVHFRLFVAALSETGQPYVRDITRQVAEFVGFKVSPKTDGIVMSGYGYSKSFQIGYSLGLALWPNGTPEPHGTRNGEPDSCGGYAISIG